MDEYNRSDFIKGFFLNVGIAIAVIIIYFFFFGFGLNKSIVLEIIAVSIVIITVGIIEFILIRRYLKERRYVAIGMIVALIIPLLVIGACSPILFFM
jgi:hypothetical protein